MSSGAGGTILEAPPTTVEPAIELAARLFSRQGFVTEAEYLALNGNYLFEYSDGCLEVLPMPTTSHQRISAFLYGALLAFVTARGLGHVLYAPLRVRLRNGKFREPDLVVMLTAHSDRIGEEYWDGADLVMEILSDNNRDHDLQTKRREYAEAGIPEYWIVDPLERAILVLTLRDGVYIEHGRFTEGQEATSALLPGFSVAVSKALASKRA